MSSQNKYSTTQVFIGSIVIIVIFIGIYMMMYSSKSSTPTPTPLVSEQFTVENFPESTPMNVMYSDPDGNLGTTTDLGLKNLTISSDGAMLLGNKFRFNGGVDALKDDDWLRMMNKENTDYYGGFAAGRLYSAGDSTVGGNLSINGYSNVKNTLSELYAKINALSSTVASNKTNTDNIINQLTNRLTSTETKLQNLENTTVKKNQEFSLKNIKDNNWFPVGLAARGSGVNLSDDCNIKTFDAVRMSMYGIDSAACPNPGNTTNNFKIVQ